MAFIYKTFIFSALLAIGFCGQGQQKVIQLYNGTAPGSENWTYSEKIYNADNENAVAANVAKPTLTLYPPDSATKSTGTAIIICPGGGFYILAINNEGSYVADS